MRARWCKLVFIVGGLLLLPDITTLHAQPAVWLPDEQVVAAFVDSLTGQLMEKYHVPGAAVVVVRDTSTILARGYGYADLARKKKVDPDRTLFHMASVSKVVTGTVVMQLVEQGRLDLHADINRYLKGFKIEEQFDRPVTLANLLTHTAGFDDRYIGKSARTEAERLPLRTFLAHQLPDRLRPPGTVFSYSNHGIALAALVAEEVAGEDFATLAKRTVLEPLDMQQASFRPPPGRADDIARGYAYEDGRYRLLPLDYLNDYPAGELFCPLSEFAHFMIAHLNGGRYRDQNILRPETARAMHTVQFTHHPRLNGGAGFTFGLETIDGHPAWVHDGGYTGTSTRMWLFPEDRIGLFIAVNVSETSFLSDLSYPLVRRFLPANRIETTYPLDPVPAHDPDVSRFTGTYRFSRYPHHTLEKVGVLMGMMSPELPVWSNDQGMLMMYDLSGRVRRLVQIEPLLFRSIDDDYTMAFGQDSYGRITFLFTNGSTALEYIPWYATAALHRMLFAVSIVFFVLAPLLAAFFRRRTSGPHLRSAYRLVSLISGFFVSHTVLLGLVLMVLIPATERERGFAYGLPPVTYVVQILPIVAAGFLAVLAVLVLHSLRTRRWSGIQRFMVGVFIVVSCGYLSLLATWNLLGFAF